MLRDESHVIYFILAKSMILTLTITLLKSIFKVERKDEHFGAIKATLSHFYWMKKSNNQ